MIKHIISFVLLLSATASAETHLTIDLDWQHQPRQDLNLAVFMEADVPQARVTFRRWDSGQQSVDIKLSNGTVCSTTTSKMMAMMLKCGNAAGFYWFVKNPAARGQLEWITQ